MSLSEDGIRGMLDEYEADHHTGMDTGYMLSFIFNKSKEPGVKEIKFGNKTLYEGLV